MNTTRLKKLFRYLLYAVFLVSFISCRNDATNYALNPRVRFLFFIPVDGESTWAISFLAVIIIGVAYSLKYLLPGWSHNEIRRDIRDNRGEIIGSIGTGEYEDSFTSQEEADRKSWIIRMSTTIITTVACVLSWFYKDTDSVWFFLPLTLICFILIRRTLKDEVFAHYVRVWEKIFIIICVICVIVYWPH